MASVEQLQRGRKKKTHKGKKEKRKKWPLCVPLLSLLARHDNTVSPSFFFLDPSGKGTCFIINSERSPPSTKSLVFLWRRRRLSGGKQSGGNTEEKVLARSDPMFGGRCARRGRSLSLKLDKICALDVLRSLIYHSCLPFSLADPEVCLCSARPKGLGQ